MSRVINLTPHPIVVYAPGANADTDEPFFTIEPTLPSARCTITRRFMHTVNVEHEDAPDRGYKSFVVGAYRTMFGAVENLPPPGGDTLYIVSKVVYDAAHPTERGAADLFIPDDTIRYEIADAARGRVKGQIAGCRAFAQP